MSPPERRWPAIEASAVSVPAHVVFRRDRAGDRPAQRRHLPLKIGIDELGTGFFEVMRDSPRLSEASVLLAEEFDQPLEVIQRDLAAFCDALAALGLVEIRPGPG